MQRRVELDLGLPPAALPGRVLNELYAHAREAQPEECCGLILGDGGERFARVVRCRNDMTKQHHRNPRAFPRDNRSAFYLDPRDYKAAEEGAEAAGQRVTALYHSHVDVAEGGGVYLSEMDLDYAEGELFPWPDAAHIVIAVCEDRVLGVGLFERDRESRSFRGRAVEAAQ